MDCKQTEREKSGLRESICAFVRSLNGREWLSSKTCPGELGPFAISSLASFFFSTLNVLAQTHRYEAI